ncbi:MAG: HAD family hydrolase [Clostridia bacterium]|nr:HAD family hydrolase [Clostridia bacterium]
MAGIIPRLIAADLDRTLLTSGKRLTDRTIEVLRGIHERFGTEIVPATGRMLTGIPEDLWRIGCIRYAITENGAGIHDVEKDEALFQCGIPCRAAADLAGFMDTLPVLYDCYIGGEAFMPERFFGDVGTYILNRSLAEAIRTRWTAVRDLKELITETGRDVMKMQCYIKAQDETERAAVRRIITEKYPEIRISSTMSFHLEIGNRDAEKGRALEILSGLLGIRLEDTMAFGDGDNDLSLIRAAGRGVAMCDASAELKRAADDVTRFGCDRDGVAEYLEGMLTSLGQ